MILLLFRGKAAHGIVKYLLEVIRFALSSILSLTFIIRKYQLLLKTPNVCCLIDVFKDSQLCFYRNSTLLRAIRCTILVIIAFGTPTAVLHYRMQYVSSTLLNITERVIIPSIGRLVIITILISYKIPSSNHNRRI